MTSNKREQRQEIAKQVEQYIERGGEVKQVARGISGRDAADGPLRPGRDQSDRRREARTPVPEVVAAIEMRRQLARKSVSKRKVRRQRRPVRRLVYDDFGEPLRYEWRDE